MHTLHEKNEENVGSEKTENRNLDQRYKMENIEVRECVTYWAPLAQTAQKQCSV